jgi:hypothetical protein
MGLMKRREKAVIVTTEGKTTSFPRKKVDKSNIKIFASLCA